MKFDSNAPTWLLAVGLLLLVLLAVIVVWLRQYRTVRQHQLRMRAVINSSLDAIVQMDSKGIITGWNHRAVQLFGWSRNEALGRALHETIIPQRYRERHQQGLARYLAGSGTGILNTRVEVEALKRDGIEFPVELIVTSIGSPQAPQFNAFLRDLTERRAETVRQKLAASVFDHAREGIIITNLAGNILNVNAAFTRITGYSSDEVLGRNPRLLQSGRQEPEFYQQLWRELKTNGQWSGEILNRRKSGELYSELLTISAVVSAQGVAQHYVALFTDISTQKNQQLQLEMLTHFDVLTGLPNRVLLTDRLQQCIGRCRRQEEVMAVVMIDLDGFKAINDTHGQEVGNAMVKASAVRLKAVLRDCDTLARVGGDEFVAVVAGLAPEQDHMPMLTRLLRAAAASVNVNGASISVTASLGVTFFPADDSDADQLIRHADQALYQAKQAGKNRFQLFDVAHDVAVKARHESAARVGAGLQNQEFVLFYQPKVHMRSGAVRGAEALIRWQHPSLGLLAPGQFLPVIEDQPVSVELGEWVIASALEQVAQWQALGLTLQVSVNIGARQLQHGGFVDALSRALAQCPGVSANLLQLEILETSAIEDMTRVSQVLRDCQALGVSFALDDFGTGYSSLAYLKNLPADVLKIDQSFVRGMFQSPTDLAIVKGVIGLSQAFRREVIAEGVETLEIGQKLLSLGCELAQGYGIARPMPAADLLQWVASWRSPPDWVSS
jgi:diguanylate cyclase (GGDEF)-like protein/PAS domain S-box-containing protein